MISRSCVFCGLRPESKTKEHIIPKWLLEFTGDHKRTFNLGIDRKWPADNFVMPACDACNNDYSDLEGATKPIVLKLLSGESITASEYSILLDWLDKVRIGLWLAFNVLDNVGIKPNFHISTRVKKDRMLLVYYFPAMKRILGSGLNFEGVYSPLFKFVPSCFGLRINDTVLINASYDFFISARVGFPFPKRWEWDARSIAIHVIEEESYHKVKSPLLRFALIEASVHLYQPVLLAGMSGNSHEYVKSNLMNPGGLEGKIFEQINGFAHAREAEQLINFQKVDEGKSVGYGDVLGQVYSLQNHLSSDPNHMGNLIDKTIKDCLDWNIEYKKNLIKHWNI